TGDRPETTEYVVLARLGADPPISEPEGFRALLNSFLPRKRAIAQLLVRDPADRVLMCHLTYKRDWDLPGGILEVGEPPREGATREVAEELALDLPAGRLLLTDWLPPWSGWDDAVCLVFDGGVHDPGVLAAMVPERREIRTAEFCDAAQIADRAADFTARRISAALASLRGEGPSYTESGR
ncbi:MAG: NUDIX hydrolase, partial [Nocardioides sp.]